jgi:DNA-binding IclR family transcriptional regulator
MQDLRDLVGHTVVITTFTGNKVVVLDLVRGRSQLEIFLNPGSEYMLHASAQGKVVLAFGDPAIAKAILERPLEKSTSNTIVDADRLRAELELVRKKGWAEAPEELFMGINALAAPINHSGGQLFGSLALVGSIHFLHAQAKPETVAALVDAAKRISNVFGTPSGHHPAVE